jgi:beta-lactamase regulating signal transducer with metallopeptidase domain
MSPALSLQAFAPVVAERMLNSVAAGLVITMLAWLLLRVSKHQSANTRFAVWFGALLVTVLLPAAGTINYASLTSSGYSARPPIVISSTWAYYGFGLWAVIAGLALMRVGQALWQLQKLRRRCTGIDVRELHPVVQQTLEKFGLQRSVKVCVGQDLQVPSAIGFFRPVVVLPAWALRELSPAELNAILLHELAHLQRWDDWTNLAQKILRALLFFHPAVWWIENKLSLEREMACDDLVVENTADAHTYAKCLVAVAEKSFLWRQFALAQAAVSRMRQTSLRVTRILDASRANSTRVWKPAFVLLAGIALACFLALPHTPRLVAFTNAPLETLSASVANPAGLSGSNPDSRHAITPAAQTKLGPRLFVSGRPDARLTTPAGKRVASRARAVTNTLAPPNMQAGFEFPPSAAARLASAAQAGGDAAPPASVWVVVQSQEFGRSGSVRWTVCVWRITRLNPDGPSAEGRIPAKKI